ncbi:hypothetical protein vseg_016969 [Gypsophila vaccaria]
MARSETYENDLHIDATELRLGLPGSNSQGKQTTSADGVRSKKRASPDMLEDSLSTNNSSVSDARNDHCPPPSKAQVVGWPPIRSYRKNNLQPKTTERGDGSGIYVKVSMDGAPYLRKIDLKVYVSYEELLQALGNMFRVCMGKYSERDGYNGSEYAPTYEDKDGDWMLVGDVPWEMFITSCKRLRIMRSSEAKGLGCS